MPHCAIPNGFVVFARRWQRLLVLAAFGMALAQTALLAHQIHDVEKPHILPCQLCLFASGQTAALPATLPVVPAPAATHESPLSSLTPAAFALRQQAAWARAPPA